MQGIEEGLAPLIARGCIGKDFREREPLRTRALALKEADPATWAQVKASAGGFALDHPLHAAKFSIVS